MLERISVANRRLAAYRDVAPAALLADLERAAAPLRGARILHLNATPYGGGVSELLRSTVPLMNDAGLDVEWKTIRGDERFFEVTKAIHNGLQGGTTALTADDRETYRDTCRRNAELLDEDYDVVFLHDPQPAGILAHAVQPRGRWVWRSHIDTSTPNPDVWRFIREFLPGFDAAVFTLDAFVPPDLPITRVAIMPPAIDPVSPKNMPLPDEVARRVLEWIGIDLRRPLITQVSRFDPWKDPMGVIAAWRLARRQIPGLQLALVGAMALDDPEGWRVYAAIEDECRRESGLHVFTNLTGVGNIEVNAFQRRSDVIVQKSIREGFGLVVSEALWKGTPVVAGRAGGIPLQLGDQCSGLLVDDVESCAAAVVNLLREPERRRLLGECGRQRVRELFLIPRLVLDELQMIDRLISVARDDSSTGSDDDVIAGDRRVG